MKDACLISKLPAHAGIAQSHVSSAWSHREQHGAKGSMAQSHVSLTWSHMAKSQDTLCTGGAEPCPRGMEPYATEAKNVFNIWRGAMSGQHGATEASQKLPDWCATKVTWKLPEKDARLCCEQS